MIPALLAQIGLPLLVRAVGSALSGSSNEVAKAAGAALKGVEEEIARGGLSGADLAEANRHIEAMAELDAGTERTWLAEINRTIRAEVASEDAYVRRMRPTFGYVVAVTWAAQMGAVAYVIATDPASAGAVVSALGSLGTIWTVGLSVLGIYVYKRSQEKQAAPPFEKANGFQALARMLGRS
ncbi:ribokinase [Marivibrio halodurans]|uniref:Ribokinase n=1 Tax=Marivibrio halodurans TaxID=2039722 RepID=A0A8J7S075_9PROT|nr:3TM-type holin [Marivibrio halodurans]MBP5856273.1 ribokinase [Marivibrio halodurans]